LGIEVSKTKKTPTLGKIEKRRVENEELLLLRDVSYAYSGAGNIESGPG